MAFGNSHRKSASLHVGWMLVALVVAAFLGASLGLFWLNSNWFSGDAEHEIVTSETPGG